MNLKKLIIAVTVVLIIVILGIFLFIPAVINISAAGYFNNNSRVCADYLLKESNWQKWWPEKITDDSNFVFQNTNFAITDRSPYAAGIDITKINKKSINSTIDLVLYKPDSTGFEWKCKLTPGNNPISRLENYFLAVEIKKNMDKLMKAYTEYVGVKKNVYGVEIDKRKFTDTFMISTEKLVTAYPDNKIIYGIIDELTDYAKTNGASMVKYPMMNIEKRDSSGYALKLALPINKQIPSSDKFRFRFMIQGNTLFATVTGGNASIENAIEQMRLYIGDYKFSAPAIPFQSMVTNRLIEPDSSKWVTNIYYPVM